LEILCLIPARSGSKSIPDKNIRVLAGKPLLAYPVEQARASKLINRVVVSTDSPRYAGIAKQYGAETPFLRPPELAGDCSTDLECFTHALEWLREKEGYRPDLCVHLRPTHPVRRVEDIDQAVRLLLDHPDADSVRSVAPAGETPFKMWRLRKDGWLDPFVSDPEIPEAYNQPRQKLPPAYIHNGAIDVVRASIILEKRSMTGKRVLGYVMEENGDIDTEEEWRRVEETMLGGALAPQGKGDLAFRNGLKTFCFDIDGVIATITPVRQYDKACPMEENIRIINALYRQGHKIVLFTARGSATGVDWTAVTERQMKEWGVRYHELRFGKPAADYYVDDRMISAEHLGRMIRGTG
jgi:CMP-N-acetylneuraminic acid synthetase